MKTIILSLIILSLMIGAPSAFAQLGAPHSKNTQAAYQSGFDWGIHDARVICKPDCRDVYIFQPGKTFYFHTKEFIRGYMTGWCSVNGPHNGIDENEASYLTSPSSLRLSVISYPNADKSLHIASPSFSQKSKL